MSDAERSGFVARLIGPKRRWWTYRARVKELPGDRRAAVEAIERYLMHFVPTDSDSNASMFEVLADLFEQAAADGTPIRGVVGEDPVEFADTFARNYSEGGYAPARARRQLTDALARAEEAEGAAGRTA
ncbi:DNA-binding ferritin-like protein (Dps family) [Streptomyces sp. CG 926]|uniref:DUF1048 domain-containing protein n=1 Tax=Streptomyces sp. CG 926 TaxID=1882405 RepID=UPI000D6D6239|nr:DUF1048 domain-containing protein [Streptomyces sp. CG 926]PWK66077.1 DNA-binding ferritin-like protein (Dps family) [Streptomyces sp. CG 926]